MDYLFVGKDLVLRIRARAWLIKGETDISHSCTGGQCIMVWEDKGLTLELFGG